MSLVASVRRRVRFSFPAYRQMDAMDCGPTCVRMIARHHGKTYSLRALRERMFQDRQGVSLLNIAYVAESLGFRTLSAKTELEALAREAPLPCVAHWEQNHFVVVHRITRTRVHVVDPAEGPVSYTHEEFVRGWAQIAEDGRRRGIVLMMEPTPAFHANEDEPSTGGRFSFLLPYARGYGRFFAQVGAGMMLVSLLQLVFPLLSQALVDHGIGGRDLSFVHVLLLAQLVLILSRTAVEFLRNRLLFHVGTRMYISITSDFLLKLLRLPLPFFDARQVGDLLQRVQDNQRIQQFVTTTTMNVAFSLFSLVVFGAVLAFYSGLIFAVFALGSVLYVGYVLLFLRWRKELDYQRFAHAARGHNALVEIATGMHEIKVANAEQQRRWKWERIQGRMFRVQLKGLSLDQAQDGGALLINELKNLAVTFLGAKLVIDGQLTLGMLLAVQYILGQLNGPLAQLTQFVHAAQDARISLDRLSEIHDRPDEEEREGKVQTLPPGGGVEMRGVSFRYGGPDSPAVLQDVDLRIPAGKVTAVVGASGSGKTTLLRLLLKFYEPTEGSIAVGGTGLGHLANRAWRSAVGVVQQDGQLFSDTIAANVALGSDDIDTRRLLHAAGVANIREYVEQLPAGYNTKVGRDGVGMSQGQKQRLLIARAVYKDPEYLFFDEATSALDASNERVIMDNLREFFRGRTVVVIAHRLSTVRDADQIVVLDRGRVVERGTHDDLTALRGRYYELVRNQLELGA
ncbi:MAG TPA: peptidase domain-containing ABC transporter [Longimicrobium sp.]|nr:peptidase domain-containing ABC transporter [Longimicrobium sp.]